MSIIYEISILYLTVITYCTMYMIIEHMINTYSGYCFFMINQNGYVPGVFWLGLFREELWLTSRLLLW